MRAQFNVQRQSMPPGGAASAYQDDLNGFQSQARSCQMPATVRGPIPGRDAFDHGPEDAHAAGIGIVFPFTLLRC